MDGLSRGFYIKFRTVCSNIEKKISFEEYLSFQAKVIKECVRILQLPDLHKLEHEQLQAVSFHDP